MIQLIPVTVMASPDDRDIEATTMLANLGGSISHETEHNNPLEAWLPITESRDGNAFTSAFHVLCSGIGVQALLLPLAFTSLGWLWGIVCLSMAFGWQLYTIWVLVHLHESAPGTRYSRYLHLAIAAFEISPLHFFAVYDGHGGSQMNQLGRGVPFVFLEEVKDDFNRTMLGLTEMMFHIHLQKTRMTTVICLKDRFSIAYNLGREFGPRLKDHM